MRPSLCVTPLEGLESNAPRKLVPDTGGYAALMVTREQFQLIPEFSPGGQNDQDQRPKYRWTWPI